MIAPREITPGPHVHLVGIGGAGMSGLARLHLELGHRVSGSDLRRSETSAALGREGASIHVGHSARHVVEGVTRVVRSAAVRDDNPEVAAARSLGIPVLKYAEELGALMIGRQGVAIAGTHGKTTTSGMAAAMLVEVGVDPMFLVGSVVAGLGRAARTGRGPFVVEACEFDRSFLHLRPEIAAILNVDDDHLDCFGDLQGVEAAFAQFAGRVSPEGLLLLHESATRIGDSPGIRARVETFGTSTAADWRAVGIRREEGWTVFEVRRCGRPHGRFRIRPVGRHNVHNSLVPVAVADRLGLSPEAAAAGLARFEGVARRLQVRVRAPGLTIYDDYAHHPTEVSAALDALRADHPGARLTAVFQPHQYARTRLLLDRFADALLGADRTVVADIFRARDRDEDVNAVCADDLARAVRARGGDAVHVAGFDRIADWLHGELGSGDVAVTMGAGNIDEVADEMARRLGR